MNHREKQSIKAARYREAKKQAQRTARAEAKEFYTVRFKQLKALAYAEYTSGTFDVSDSVAQKPVEGPMLKSFSKEDIAAYIAAEEALG